MDQTNRRRTVNTPEGVSRRRVLQVGGVSALGMLIAACGPGSGGNGGAADGNGGDPVQGGDLVYATAHPIRTLDPAFSQDIGERFVLYAVFNNLVGYDENFDLVPELAESWETSEDGQVVTLHLRQNVSFHDGTPFNAEATKWNLDRILNEDTNSPIRGSLTPPLETVEVVDEFTIELHTDRPWRPLLASLGERAGFIVSPAAVEEYGDEFGTNPVGTGPFQLETFTRDNEIRLTRFEEYWNSDEVYLDSITVRTVPEQEQQQTMLSTGEAHIADETVPQLAASLRNDDNVDLLEDPTGAWYAVQMDCDKPPFESIELRQAIAHATNREGVQSAIYQDMARIATGPLGAGWAQPDESDPMFPYSLETARQLAQEAGVEGETIRFRNSSASDYQSVAQLLAGDYGDLGFTLEQSTAPASDYYNEVVEDQNYWSVTQWTPRGDPDGLLRILFHSEGGQNTTGYNNPEVDQLLDEAAETFDTDVAAEMYQQVAEIVEREAPYAFIIWPDSLVPHHSSVGGLRYYPDTIYRLRDLWINA